MITTRISKKNITSEQLFMISVLIVNGGNYVYNLLLGRILGPELFADAAVLITLLLVLSFIAMTFQLVTAKFAVLFRVKTLKSFVSVMYKNALFIGVALGVLIIVFSTDLQQLFRTSSSNMFIVFGAGVPIYFLMSINRGVFQGKKEFKSLSITYQTEMLSRLLITLGLILIFDIKSPMIIAIGIFISFVFGLFPFKAKLFNLNRKMRIRELHKKQIKTFFIITAFYECTQIIINNSDILLVKHYFESYEAGLYASLALIGRMVYFIAWMFVMLLLPKVIELKKQGRRTTPILFKYVGYISGLSFAVVLCCFFFPKTIVHLFFGESYLEISSLLWKYAFATALFAISNIFAYYYLSLDKYIPVIISGIFGVLQVALISLFHKNLEQVVVVQIIAMVLLLVVQLFFFKLLKNRY